MRHILLLATIAGSAALATSVAAADTHDWRTYANARFGYAICYPADLVQPQAEADNGDGRAFTGAGGAELRVYGRNNATDDTLKSAQKDDEARLATDGGAVTYKAAKANWYVLSGRQGDRLFYVKTRLVKDQFEVFELSYPAAAAKTWNPVAAHISDCFTHRP